MPNFYRKTGRVEAEQFNPDDAGQADRLGIVRQPGGRIAHCTRSVGRAVVEVGDWIVKDEYGQITVWPDDKFRETYQFVAGG